MNNLKALLQVWKLKYKDHKMIEDKSQDLDHN